MKNLIIRKAEIKDEFDTIVVRHQSWLSAYCNIFSEEKINEHFHQKYNDQIYRERNKKRIEKTEHFYVAELNGQVVGIMIIELQNSMQKAEIECLYVLPEVQRQGVGSKLFEYAIKIMKNNNIFSFNVVALKDNEVGSAFYKKKGGDIIKQYTDELCDQIVTKVVYEFKI